MYPNRSLGVGVCWEKKAFDEDSKNAKQLPQMFLFSHFWEFVNATGRKKSFFNLTSVEAAMTY